MCYKKNSKLWSRSGLLFCCIDPDAKFYHMLDQLNFLRWAIAKPNFSERFVSRNGNYQINFLNRKLVLDLGLYYQIILQVFKLKITKNIDFGQDLMGMLY